jgi:hypothetical protein
MGERRGVYKVLVGTPEGKKPCGIPRHRFNDNIRRDLQEMGWGGLDWINLAQDNVVAGACECHNEPIGSINCKEFF